MASYRLSRRAAADVDEIAEYTIERFGIKQARRYRDGLDKCFQTLAGYFVSRAKAMVSSWLHLVMDFRATIEGQKGP